MGTFISFFKYLVSSNAINFILMVCLLCWIYKKMNLSNLFVSGINSIQNLISSSENEKDVAAKTFHDARIEADNLPEKLQLIDKEAMDSAVVVCKNIDDSANKIVDGIRDNITKTVLNEEKYLSSVVTRESVVKIVEGVRKNVLSSLKDNPELQNEFINRSLEEFEEAKI